VQRFLCFVTAASTFSCWVRPTGPTCYSKTKLSGYNPNPNPNPRCQRNPFLVFLFCFCFSRKHLFVLGATNRLDMRFQNETFEFTLTLTLTRGASAIPGFFFSSICVTAASTFSCWVRRTGSTCDSKTKLCSLLLAHTPCYVEAPIDGLGFTLTPEVFAAVTKHRERLRVNPRLLPSK